MLLKAEAMGPDDQPLTLFEVTRLVFGKAGAKPILLPTNCTPNNSVMDETGTISAHAELTTKVELNASANVGNGSLSITSTVTTGTSASTPASALPRPPKSVAAKDVVERLNLKVEPATVEPTTVTCSQLLTLSAEIVLKSGDPVSLSSKWIRSMDGIEVPESRGLAQDFSASTEPRFAGASRKLRFAKSGKGEMLFEVAVVDAKGKLGEPMRSKPIPFEIKCTRKPISRTAAAAQK